MERDLDMAQIVSPEMPSAAEIAACWWLPDDDLRWYNLPSVLVAGMSGPRACCPAASAHRHRHPRPDPPAGR